jgi:hypothetical protein
MSNRISTLRGQCPQVLACFAQLITITTMLLSSGCSTSAGGGETKSATRGAPEEFGLTLAQLASRVDETERLIADCMRLAGFQYVPLDFATVKEAMASDKSAPGVTSEDYIKQFGLGITTQFDKPIVVFGAGPTNSETLHGLAEAAQLAYKRSLWGEAPDWNHVRALEEEDFSETGGCTRSAAERTYKPAELFGTYVNPADKLLEQDPRVIAATKKWAACMRADGFQYDNPTQVDDDLRLQLAGITRDQNPRTLTGPALDTLTALQDQERAIAARLTTCEEEHLEPVVAKVEAELTGARPN